MGFINFKTKENTRKCADCKFNIANFTFKVSDKGYLKFLDVDEDVNETARKLALGVMWSACKVCPVRPDFVKVYGVEPIDHYAGTVESKSEEVL